MEKIKSTYYPARGRAYAYEGDCENNSPPKIDSVVITGEPGPQELIAQYLYADAPIISIQLLEEAHNAEREKKMRKVIAHLNSKPFKISGDVLCYLVVIVGVSWFIGRALWQWLT